MSLVCHTIVSRYTPQQRDPVDTTGEAEAEADPWQTESSFGHAERLHSRPAPSFVPACLQYDEYGMPRATDAVQPQQNRSYASQDVSAWYRDLTARGSVKLEKRSSADNILSVTASTSHSSHRSPDDDDDDVSHSRVCVSPSSKKRNWFISCPSQVPATHASKPSTLADLLLRNPPPCPSEPSFNPPVFLTIGPSNKGFAMLQRKGWQEGEGLGSARVERKPKEGLGFTAFQDRIAEQQQQQQRNPISYPSDSDVKPFVNVFKQEIIDLTLSDSEFEEEEEEEEKDDPSQEQVVIDLTLSDSDLHDDKDQIGLADDTTLHSAPHRTTLLTPIATTLKADRLGIGLKAARHSRSARAKAVTHTSAALAAHIRQGKQTRIDRARHGRGSRGFARARRKEERERVDLLAYMNSS